MLCVPAALAGCEEPIHNRIHGTWTLGDHAYDINDDGSFEYRAPGSEPQRGSWGIQGDDDVLQLFQAASNTRVNMPFRLQDDRICFDEDGTESCFTQ